MANIEKNSDTEKITPMMKQYLELKEEYKGYVLFFRLGDFYEMFNEDAVNISRELELTLTARNGTPMCGVPHHSSEVYIKRLIDKGFKVAICEQVSDPKEGKTLVERDVVRLVTPGTVIESGMLDETSNNYICCIYADDNCCGIIFSDISTGDVHAFEKSGLNIENEIISELSRYMPAEVLFNEEFLNYKKVHRFIKERIAKCVCELCDDKDFDISDLSVIKEQLGVSSIDHLSISTSKKCIASLCAVFRYFSHTHKAAVKRFVNINMHYDAEYMSLPLTTRRNLELIETIRGRERKGSLLWVLDKTSTSMGKRRLKSFIEQPLVNPNEILRRLEAVRKLCQSPTVMYDLALCLKNVYDIERLMSRIVFGTASPRDVFSLGVTAKNLPELRETLSGVSSPLLDELYNSISPLTEIANLIDNAISEECPANVKDGGTIKPGFNEELDKLRDICSGGNDVLDEIEVKERTITGIKNLKIGYNRVFGYYIEVSKSNINAVPDNYVRKQTLANCERYITSELKQTEVEILNANEKIKEVEGKIFAEIKSFIAAQLDVVQETASALSYLDVMVSFAVVSVANSYVKPDITMNGVIEIKDGRHPVIEQVLDDGLFVPNDTYLDINENRLIIITGPNMAGKSTYMRQVALITLMAQIGCFVPAKYARIGIVDKIFTRIGASDDLVSGQSTFMVEMNEVSEILSDATSRSLVILDEIGRGTSTFDGISIAKSVAEHIASKKGIGCKTLFATHYHELISLEQEQQGVRNFSVAINRSGGGIKFLHKVVEGGTPDSYGIEVAKLAGLPSKIINRAGDILRNMELESKTLLNNSLKQASESETQFDFTYINEQKAISKLRNTEKDITPEQAKQLILEIKEMIK